MSENARRWQWEFNTSEGNKMAPPGSLEFMLMGVEWPIDSLDIRLAWFMVTDEGVMDRGQLTATGILGGQDHEIVPSPLIAELEEFRDLLVRNPFTVARWRALQVIEDLDTEVRKTTLDPRVVESIAGMIKKLPKVPALKELKLAAVDGTPDGEEGSVQS